MADYKPPTEGELKEFIGDEPFAAWKALVGAIDALYDVPAQWGRAVKNWTHEYKYRRGGKTLCGFYARDGGAGFMVILGREERERFEARRSEFSPAIQRDYDEATTYHDGKWIMFPLLAGADLEGYARLLSIKRRPNRKA